MGLTKASLLSQVLEIRKAASTFMVDTVSLYNRIGDTITDGQSIPTYDTVKTVDARIINRSGAGRTQETSQHRSAQQTFYDTQYRIQLPYGTVIRVNDRIYYTDKASGRVTKLEVVFVPAQHDLMGAFIVGANEVV